MKNKTLIISFTLVTLFSCSKDRLTKETQKGANTFSCKIDGIVFKPSEEGTSWSGANSLTVSNSQFNGFTLNARKFSTSTSLPVNVLIRLPYLNSTGPYSLTINGYGEYEVDYSMAPVYRTNNIHTGSVNITRCDTINQIYSGTFYFKAIDDNTGKIVNITDGRFDVKRN